MPQEFHTELFSAAMLPPHTPAEGLETHSVTDWVIMNSVQHISMYLRSAFSVLCVFCSFSMSIIMELKETQSLLSTRDLDGATHTVDEEN